MRKYSLLVWTYTINAWEMYKPGAHNSTNANYYHLRPKSYYQVLAAQPLKRQAV